MPGLVESLRAEIRHKEGEVEQLRERLRRAEHEAEPALEPVPAPAPAPASTPAASDPDAGTSSPANPAGIHWQWQLPERDYNRYARQLVLPDVGLAGYQQLKRSSVLVVGLGGLGCPAAMYLAGAGVGRLGLVDGDDVELSNLHRQILHDSTKIGMSKVDSAVEALRRLNPDVTYQPHRHYLTPETAVGLVGAYDLVLDCTDSPASRYLVSDAAVLAQRPLVSAAALGTDGQLLVLNHPAAPAGCDRGGPCYRCVYPTPPPPQSVRTCGEHGILGPVVGLMGVLQALKALRVLLQPIGSGAPAVPASMAIFQDSGDTALRQFRLRRRRPACPACSAAATVSETGMRTGAMDYVRFCGSLPSLSFLQPHERLAVDDFQALRAAVHNNTTSPLPRLPSAPVIVDVRESWQFALAHFSHSLNLPFSRLSCIDSDRAAVEQWATSQAAAIPAGAPLLAVCQNGNDSQLAVAMLERLPVFSDRSRWIGDLTGGLAAWGRRYGDASTL